MIQDAPRIPPPSRRLAVVPVRVFFLMTIALTLLSSGSSAVSYAASSSSVLASSTVLQTDDVQRQGRSIAEASGTAQEIAMPRLTGANSLPRVAQAETSQPSEEDVRKQAEETRRARDTFLREERVLFRRGELQLEFSTFYSMDTQDLLIPVPGGDSLLVKSKNREVSTSLLGRYGLVNNLELVVEIPFFVYTEQTAEFQLGGVEQTLDASGLGDISGSLRWQLWRETAAIPDVIVELNGQFPTGDELRFAGDEQLLGTGEWAVGGGVTLVKTLDPVVLFGRVGYTHRFGDLGDVFSASMGMGFSLNDRVSFNMQVLGAYVEGSTIDATTLGDDSSLEIISLQFAVTVLVSGRLFVEPVVNFGLSDDAVDVVVGVNMPFQF